MLLRHLVCPCLFIVLSLSEIYCYRVARTHNYFTECNRCHEEGTERCERLNVTGFEFSSRCICIYGYVGLYCEYIGCRHDETCYNNGTCDTSDINTDGICRCPPKWSGSKCQYEIYRFGWDIDTEKDFVKTGNITFHPDGQDGTVHHGRIIRGEKFELTIFGIGKRYYYSDFCVRFWYNLADKGADLRVLLERENMAPNQLRPQFGNGNITEYGVWREAKVFIHAFIHSNLIIRGSTSSTTKYLALDQIKVKRSSCDDIGL